MLPRTDLAMEAAELYARAGAGRRALPGLSVRRRTSEDVKSTRICITSEKAESVLGKPCGTYIHVELSRTPLTCSEGFSRAVSEVARALKTLLLPGKSVLVAGLGNPEVTPDALGPQALRSLLVTRHLKQQGLRAYESLCELSAFSPGVPGLTGMQSLELVQAVCEKLHPEQLVVVDALAAAEPEQICTGVQLSDTGLVPGSGLGTRNSAFSSRTLGLPVVSVGVPTLSDAPGAQAGMMITLRDIDSRMRQMARVVGCALDLALHRGMELRELPLFWP